MFWYDTAIKVKANSKGHIHSERAATFSPKEEYWIYRRIDPPKNMGAIQISATIAMVLAEMGLPIDHDAINAAIRRSNSKLPEVRT